MAFDHTRLPIVHLRPLGHLSKDSEFPERVGFEPTVMQSTTPDFESGSFDHSDISPDETKRIRTSDPQFRKLMLYPAEL